MGRKQKLWEARQKMACRVRKSAQPRLGVDREGKSPTMTGYMEAWFARKKDDSIQRHRHMRGMLFQRVTRNLVRL